MKQSFCKLVYVTGKKVSIGGGSYELQNYEYKPDAAGVGTFGGESTDLTINLGTGTKL